MSKKKHRLGLDGILHPIEDEHEVIKKGVSGMRYISLASELGVSVVVLVLGGIFLGRYLDAQFQTTPVLTLICIGCALLLTGYNIYKGVKELISS